MSLKERVYSVLLVCASNSFNTAAADLFPASQYQPFCVAASISEAKRCLTDRDWDFIIINSPCRMNPVPALPLTAVIPKQPLSYCLSKATCTPRSMTRWRRTVSLPCQSLPHA